MHLSQKFPEHTACKLIGNVSMPYSKVVENDNTLEYYCAYTDWLRHVGNISFTISSSKIDSYVIADNFYLLE